MAARRTSQQITDEIISKLDIAAEYTALGVKLAADHPTDKGWISCYAYGREDSKASAAIQIDTGVYKDQGGKCTTCGLFQFAVEIAGKFSDWKTARNHYAVVAGMGTKLPKNGNEPVKLEDRIDVGHGWNGLIVRGLLAAYPGITDLALRMTGATLALYPKHRKRPDSCVAVPVYSPRLLNDVPVGYIVMQSSGQPMKTKTGEKKRIVLESSGLVNRRGLTMIMDGRAKLIVKVEGFTDVVTFQGKLNDHPEYIDKIAVVTNACGARETTLPVDFAGVFSTIPTIIVHDADEPGQIGAAFWSQEVGKFTEVANLQLPYPIVEKHGKDIRNWFTDTGNETRGIDEFLQMVREQYPGFLDAFDGKEVSENRIGIAVPSASGGDNGNGDRRVNGSHSGNGSIPQNRLPPVDGSGAAGKDHAGLPDKPRMAQPIAGTITQYQVILKRLGMIVLGMPEGTNNVAGFCERNGRTFILERVSSLKMADLVLHLGPEIVPEIQTGDEKDPNKLAMSAIQLAIAAEGSKTRLTGKGYLGVGIWELCGRLMIVNAGEATIVNGDITRTTVPLIDGKIFDFGESQKWFDHDWFVEEFKRTENREYSMGVLNEAIEIFGRWDNWTHKHNPEIVASLICCSWIQTIWDYRPQACVVGGSNSGKTSLFTVTKAMFCQGRMTVGGADPTMAWIRQSLGNTAKIISCDEFEHPHRRKECLDGFRAASRGETVGRGTSGQKGISFTLRHLPWHGAISADFRSAADRNRYLMLELNPVPKGRGSTLSIPSAQECENLGLRLMVVAVRNWQRAKMIAAAIKKVNFEGVDRRIVESFSVPCGMIAAILGLDDAESVELTKDFLKERNFDEQSESDEQTLLREIYESPVQLDGGKKSSMSMLIKGAYGNSYNDAMIRCGVRKILKGAVEYLFFCESSICANLFTDQAKKSTGVSQILARVPGAIRDRQRMGAHNPRGVSIAISTIDSLMGVMEGQEDAAFDEIGSGERAEITELSF